MAKGQIAKQEILDKILETFAGAFVTAEGKECRIPTCENGETIEIKVALTAAKDIIGSGTPQVATSNTEGDFPLPVEPSKPAELTQEELDNVANLMQRLGF